MAKAVGADAIMSAAELKPLLLLSKHGPVSCAIGMTKDKHGVIFLDKKAKPRKAMAELRKVAAGASVEVEASSIRFGRAHVNAEADAGLVHLTVNKEAPAALRPKLIEHLKKAGFGRCEIAVDTALDEADEDGAGPGHEHGHSHPQPHPAGADPAALTHKLTTLVKAMGTLGLHGPELDAMKAVAVSAQGALKAGHAANAEKDIAQLEHLVRGHAQGRHASGNGAHPGASPGAPNGSAAHAGVAHAGNAPHGSGAHAGGSGGKPSLHSKSGHELEVFKQLDAAQHEHGAQVKMGGKPVPVAQAVQEMHGHLQRAKHFSRDLLHRYNDERAQVPAIGVFYDGCDKALDGVSVALNAKPPQLAAAYNHLQIAYLNFDHMQSQLSEERGLAVDNLTACMEGAKAVRTAAGNAVVVLATAYSPALGNAATLAVDLVNNASDLAAAHAGGEKVNLGKAAGQIVLDLILMKCGKPLGEAVEHRVGSWVASHIGPYLQKAEGSGMFHAFEDYMKKNAAHIPFKSPEYWAKVPEFLKHANLEKKIVEAVKDKIMEEGKAVFAEAAGFVAQPGDYTPAELAKRVRTFIDDVRSGKHLREDTIPKYFAKVAGNVLPHSKAH